MRILLFIAVVFVCVKTSNAQDAEKNRFAIGISFSPDINYRTLSNNDGSFSSGVVIDVRNDNETFKFGYTTGVNAVYLLNDKVEFETGLLFSRKGYRSKKKKLTYGSQFNGTGFNDSIPEGLPSNARFIYDHYYIDVPLKVNFNFGKKRLRWCIGAGITTNIFIKETVRWKLWYVDRSTERDSRGSEFAYNGLTLSPQLSAGINYKVNEKIYVKAEPTFRYGILNIIDTPVGGYLWNAGLNVGCYLKL